MNTELAWAAGFFDGEGTVSSQGAKGTRNRYLKLRVAHVDPRPLRRFAEAVGLGNVTGPLSHKNGGGRWSDFYSWQLTGRPAEEAISFLWPYLAEAKRDQYHRVKEALNQLPERP